MKLRYTFLLLLACGTMMIHGQKNRHEAVAYFAGGCFWCMEPPFEKKAGVQKVTAGYMGGQGTDPTYATYADQGYVEVIEVQYDPKIVSYKELLDIFWHNIDPTDSKGQFGDRGPSYRSIIFYQNNHEKKEAEQSKKELAASHRFNKPIATEISKASSFYPAEEYHQDYYKKNPVRYKWYRYRSGRDQFLKKAWGNKKEGKKVDRKK